MMVFDDDFERKVGEIKSQPSQKGFKQFDGFFRLI